MFSVLYLQPRLSGKQAIFYKTKLFSQSLVFPHLPRLLLSTINPTFFLYKTKFNSLLQKGANSTRANLKTNSLEAKLVGRTTQVVNEVFFLEPLTCTAARTQPPPPLLTS